MPQHWASRGPRPSTSQCSRARSSLPRTSRPAVQLSASATPEPWLTQMAASLEMNWEGSHSSPPAAIHCSTIASSANPTGSAASTPGVGTGVATGVSPTSKGTDAGYWSTHALDELLATWPEFVVDGWPAAETASFETSARAQPVTATNRHTAAPPRLERDGFSLLWVGCVAVVTDRPPIAGIERCMFGSTVASSTTRCEQESVLGVTHTVKPAGGASLPRHGRMVSGANPAPSARMFQERQSTAKRRARLKTQGDRG
jgi:hypothetical protein